MKKTQVWPVMRVVLAVMSGVLLVLFRQHIWPSIKLALMGWALLNTFCLVILLVGSSLTVFGTILEKRIKTDSGVARKVYKIIIITLCVLAPFAFSIVLDWLIKGS